MIEVKEEEGAGSSRSRSPPRGRRAIVTIRESDTPTPNADATSVAPIGELPSATTSGIASTPAPPTPPARRLPILPPAVVPVPAPRSRRLADAGNTGNGPTDEDEEELTPYVSQDIRETFGKHAKDVRKNIQKIVFRLNKTLKGVATTTERIQKLELQEEELKKGSIPNRIRKFSVPFESASLERNVADWPQFNLNGFSLALAFENKTVRGVLEFVHVSHHLTNLLLEETYATHHKTILVQNAAYNVFVRSCMTTCEPFLHDDTDHGIDYGAMASQFDNKQEPRDLLHRTFDTQYYETVMKARQKETEMRDQKTDQQKLR